MHFLHTSDWHLGKILHETSLLEDQSFFLDRLLEHIATLEKQNPCDALLVPGDIYDRSVPPAEAQKLLSRFFVGLREIASDLPVILIPGNHDHALRMEYGSEIFSLSGIHFLTDPLRVEEPVRVASRKGTGESAVVFGIPYLYPGVYQQEMQDSRELENHPSSSPKKEWKSGMEMDWAIEKIRKAPSFLEARKRGEPVILLSHCFTAGGKESDSERVFVGSSAHVSLDLFRSFDYTALGHLHRPQNPGKRISYCGSPLKYSFSESNDEKGILDIQIQGTDITRESVRLPFLHDLQRITLDAANIEPDQISESLREAYLEIRLEGPEAMVPTHAYLKSVFPRLLSIRRSVGSLENLPGYFPERRGRGSPTVLEEFERFYEELTGTPPEGEDRKLFQREWKKLEEVNG